MDLGPSLRGQQRWCMNLCSLGKVEPLLWDKEFTVRLDLPVSSWKHWGRWSLEGEAGTRERSLTGPGWVGWGLEGNGQVGCSSIGLWPQRATSVKSMGSSWWPPMLWVCSGPLGVTGGCWSLGHLSWRAGCRTEKRVYIGRTWTPLCLPLLPLTNQDVIWLLLHILLFLTPPHPRTWSLRWTMSRMAQRILESVVSSTIKLTREQSGTSRAPLLRPLLKQLTETLEEELHICQELQGARSQPIGASQREGHWARRIDALVLNSCWRIGVNPTGSQEGSTVHP